MGFNKFAWIDAVAADGRLTEGERFVLTMTAFRYVTYGEDIFHVRQTTIAERFATSERTVRRAQKQARDYGYLVVVQLRQRGRGHHGPNHLRLVIPANLASITEVIPATDARNTGQECNKYRPNMHEIPATADPSTSGNNTPEGSLIGLLIGSQGGVWLGDGEPRCAAHANTPNPPPCHRCKRVREQTEAQTPRPSTADQRVAQIQALKRNPPPEALP